LTSEGALVIKPQKLDRKEIAELIKKVRGSMKMGTSVMDEVRAEGPY